MWEPVGEDLLDGLLAALDDGEVRLDAACAIAELVANSYGADGAVLGATMRARGAVKRLAELLSDPSDDLKAQALHALGNLCSDAVDPESSLTKQLLLQLGSAQALLACARSDDTDVRLLGCATLQNLCNGVEWATVVMALGAVPIFESYVATPGEDPQVVHYSSGLLKNCLSSMEAAGVPAPPLSESSLDVVHRREMEAVVLAFRQRRAVRIIATAARRMTADARLQRVLRHVEAEVRQLRRSAPCDGVRARGRVEVV